LHSNPRCCNLHASRHCSRSLSCWCQTKIGIVFLRVLFCFFSSIALASQRFEVCLCVHKQSQHLCYLKRTEVLSFEYGSLTDVATSFQGRTKLFCALTLVVQTTSTLSSAGLTTVCSTTVVSICNPSKLLIGLDCRVGRI
jgi:hypothetical protein